MSPFATIQRVVLWPVIDVDSEAQNSQERWASPESAIEPEDEFVEIRLKVLMHDSSLVCTGQPAFQVRDDEMHERQPSTGLMSLVNLCSTNVSETECLYAVVPLPAVGMDLSSLLYVRFNPRQHGLCAGIWNDGHAYAPSALAENWLATSLRALLMLRGAFNVVLRDMTAGFAPAGVYPTHDLNGRD